MTNRTPDAAAPAGAPRPAGRRRRFVRILRIPAALLLLASVAVAALGAYCRLDKTHVFLRVRGEYERVETLECWDTPDSLVREIGLVNDRGEQVSTALCRRPRELTEPYQVLVTYAGAKTGQKILDLIPERSDLVLVAVQYPYERPSSVLAYLRWPYDVRLAAYRTVAGGMLAVSYLVEDEGLDASRITILGASLGSIFATIHAALDPRVPICLLVHGGGDLPWILRANAESAVVGIPASWFAALFLDTFDPVRYASRIAPRELWMIATRRDRYFPPESIQTLYDHAREPKQLIWTNTDHVRSRKDELVAELVRRVEAYLEQRQALAGRTADPEPPERPRK